MMNHHLMKVRTRMKVQTAKTQINSSPQTCPFIFLGHTCTVLLRTPQTMQKQVPLLNLMQTTMLQQRLWMQQLSPRHNTQPLS